MKPPSDGTVGLARRASRVRLGEVCEIAHCDAPVGESKVWLLNLDKVEQQTGRVIGKLFVCKSEIGSSTVPFDVRCVLYSKLRPNLNKVVIPDSPGFATSEILPLLPDESKITRDYLAAYLRSNPFVRYATTKSFGAKMPRLGTRDLLMAQLPLPPLPTQRHIAAVLDKICEMKRNAEARLQKLDLLVKARFVEMFGDPIANSKNRKTTVFEDVVKLQRGFDLPVQNRDDSGEIPIYGSNGLLGFHTDARAHDGIVTGRSGTIGNVYCVKGKYWPLNTSLFSIDTHGNDIIYLSWLLRLFKLERFRAGTGVPTLNRNDVHRQKIIDVDISEQREFAAFVARVDALKATVQAALERTDLLYRAKLQEYFG